LAVSSAAYSIDTRIEAKVAISSALLVLRAARSIAF